MRSGNIRSVARAAISIVASKCLYKLNSLLQDKANGYAIDYVIK